jgi:hypothetical protein
MAQAFDDLSGRVFFRLTVLEFDHFDRHHASWYRVKCVCGTEKVIRRAHLISLGTVSCGCWRRELNVARCGKKSTAYRHGMRMKGTDDTAYEKWKWQQFTDQEKKRIYEVATRRRALARKALLNADGKKAHQASHEKCDIPV